MSLTSFVVMSKEVDDPIPENQSNLFYSFQGRSVYILPSCLESCYRQGGLFEAHLIEWCRQFCRKDGAVLDIGAHSGTYTVALAPYCKKVYSFEPPRWTYYALCGSVVLSNLRNVDCLPIALGSPNQAGRQVLNIVSEDGGGSSLVRKTLDRIALGHEIVEVVTLDSLDLHGICFIKMNVEDNEAAVLEGARETLRSNVFPPILFESNSHSHLMGVRSVLDSLGYRIIPIQGIGNMFLADHDR